MTAANPGSKPRLLTGDRPTGPLHLGHLVGSLKNRVALQDDHDCFFIVADLHTLTTRPEATHISALPGHVRSIVLDLLSAGVDPKRSTIYLQSGVPAVYDLAILLQMLTPRARVESMASLAQMARDAGKSPSEISLGLLGYPVLQAADILMAQAEVIPVGGDNLAHVELARELAARFNESYGEVFPLPRARSSRVPMLPGIGPEPDEPNIKMSKSIGNVINLGESTDSVVAKIGTLSGGRLQAFAVAFAEEHLEESDPAKLREAVVAGIEAELEPMRGRRRELSSDPGQVDEIIVDGTIRAREVAYGTLMRVRETMGIEALWRGLVDTAEARAEARKKNVHG